jgi:hypothetical protein
MTLAALQAGGTCCCHPVAAEIIFLCFVRSVSSRAYAVKWFCFYDTKTLLCVSYGLWVNEVPLLIQNSRRFAVSLEVRQTSITLLLHTQARQAIRSYVTTVLQPRQAWGTAQQCSPQPATRTAAAQNSGRVIRQNYCLGMLMTKTDTVAAAAGLIFRRLAKICLAASPCLSVCLSVPWKQLENRRWLSSEL